MKKTEEIEIILERIEDTRLLLEAKKVAWNYNEKTAYSQESLLSELGISEQEIDDLADSIEIE